MFSAPKVICSEMKEKLPLGKEATLCIKKKKKPDISSITGNPSDLDKRFDNLIFCFIRRKLTDKIASKI